MFIQNRKFCGSLQVERARATCMTDRRHARTVRTHTYMQGASTHCQTQDVSVVSSSLFGFFFFALAASLPSFNTHHATPHPPHHTTPPINHVISSPIEEASCWRDTARAKENRHQRRRLANETVMALVGRSLKHLNRHHRRRAL